VLDQLPIGARKDERGDGLAIAVGDVERSDGLDLGQGSEDHLVRDPRLLLLEPCQRPVGREVPHEVPGEGIHPRSDHAHPFPSELRRRLVLGPPPRPAHRPRGVDHAVHGQVLRFGGGKPLRDEWGRPRIAEGLGEGTVGGDPAGRDGEEERAEGAREVGDLDLSLSHSTRPGSPGSSPDRDPRCPLRYP